MITNPQAEIYGIRPAKPEDFVERPQVAPSGPRISHVRDLHHKIARAIVAGHKNVAISEQYGISPARITQLKSDPAFKGLLEEYRSEDKARYDAAQDRLASVFYLSIEVLQERLLDDPEAISNSELLRILEAVADRSGHSPVRRSQIEGTFTARSERIEQIKKEAKLEMVQRRTGESNVGRVVDHPAKAAQKLPENAKPEGGPALPSQGGEGTPATSFGADIVRALDTLRESGED